MIKVRQGEVDLSPDPLLLKEHEDLSLISAITASKVILTSDLLCILHGLGDTFSEEEALYLWQLAAETYVEMKTKGEQNK